VSALQRTPGPWRAESWTQPPACGAITVLADDPSHFSGRQVVAECTNEADALLIAAAPELLEALKCVLDTRAYLPKPLLDQVYAAIDKATRAPWPTA
jgi:hypothetical protein